MSLLYSRAQRILALAQQESNNPSRDHTRHDLDKRSVVVAHNSSNDEINQLEPRDFIKLDLPCILSNKKVSSWIENQVIPLTTGADGEYENPTEIAKENFDDNDYNIIQSLSQTNLVDHPNSTTLKSHDITYCNPGNAHFIPIDSNPETYLTECNKISEHSQGLFASQGELSYDLNPKEALCVGNQPSKQLLVNVIRSSPGHETPVFRNVNHNSNTVMNEEHEAIKTYTNLEPVIFEDNIPRSILLENEINGEESDFAAVNTDDTTIIVQNVICNTSAKTVANVSANNTTRESNTLTCPNLSTNLLMNTTDVIEKKNTEESQCTAENVNSETYVADSSDDEIPLSVLKCTLKKKRTLSPDDASSDIETLEKHKTKQNKKLTKKHKKVLPGCANMCIKKCSSRFSSKQREDINKEFWKMSNSEQKIVILNSCQRINVKRTSGEGTRRKNTFKYFLSNENGQRDEVCKIFFLTTLGYKKNNDAVVYHTLSKTPKGRQNPLPHGNKGKIPSNKINDENINLHIESFNPCVSHYRREHAPNVRYLSSDITITLMYNDFKKKIPCTKVSYETYRKKVKAKKISFTKLGHEECDLCETFSLHPHNENNIDDSCQICKTWIRHKNRARESRKLYQEHSVKTFEAGTVCVSADLQKIVMLPRMDMFKCVIFLKRLIAYNETFVPVGKFSSKKYKPYAVIWHEAISKRSKEDLISSFYAFILSQRDAKEIIIWLDNCASQNKNWALFTFLVRIINSDEINSTKITFNYFEPGHTFMSADSFHHQVELSMKHKQKLYDFEDFADAVGNACKSNVNVKRMTLQDFFQWKDLSSSQKLNQKVTNRPYLSDIVQIIAERGKFTLKYKESFSGEEKTLDFLMKSYMKKGTLLKNIECLQAAQGFPKEKKEALLKAVNTIIPESRKLFWQNLPLKNMQQEEEDF